MTLSKKTERRIRYSYRKQTYNSLNCKISLNNVMMIQIVKGFKKLPEKLVSRDCYGLLGTLGFQASAFSRGPFCVATQVIPT